MKRYCLSISYLAGLIIFLSGNAAGTLQLPVFFSDNMVFQRQKPIVIRGSAEPDENIFVRLEDKTQTDTKADKKGQWQVQLPAMQAGGPYTLTIKGKQDQKIISGIYVGDVWVFSGQSNMQISFDYFLNLDNIDAVYKDRFKQTLANCEHDTRVRHFMVATKDRHGETIRNTAENQWLVPLPEQARHINPIAYYFAREVSQKTNVMTAVVRLAWGGRHIERFYQGAEIFEYMIKPWGQFPVKGVIWYQGENNLYKDGDRLAYALKLQWLIQDFRNLWNDPQLPFYIVQLPPAQYSSQPFNDEYSLPIFLEAQRQALSIPHTAMANTADLGMANGLHQPQKYDVAIRLANLAFANVYGFADAIPAGPQYRHYTREGNKIRVHFETFGSTLTTKDRQEPRYFEILPDGKNQSFVKAEAKIDGNTVLVWNKEVDKPVDVRFAFREQDLMNINLTNASGIPAATFWAGATQQLHPGLLQ